jgi:ribosomal-protein-alanine N-acetyltransferase
LLYACETNRLVLKILDREAAPQVLAFYEGNKDLFEPWEPKRSDNFYTLFYQKASLSAESHQIADGKLLRYWVFHKENPKEIIGSISFQNFLMAPYLNCSIGYKFGQKYNHCGYAYESIQKAIEILWKDYHIHRIEAFIMPDNSPSLRLIERLHFEYEGISRSYAHVNGIWSDHKRYALLNPFDCKDYVN